MRKNSKKVTTGCRQPCDILHHWSGKGYLSSYNWHEYKQPIYTHHHQIYNPFIINIFHSLSIWSCFFIFFFIFIVILVEMLTFFYFYWISRVSHWKWSFKIYFLFFNWKVHADHLSSYPRERFLVFTYLWLNKESFASKIGILVFDNIKWKFLYINMPLHWE